MITIELRMPMFFRTSSLAIGSFSRRIQAQQRFASCAVGGPRRPSPAAAAASAAATTDFDVLIVGGGVVGASLARLLQQLSPSLRVGLIEAGNGPKPLPAADSADAAAVRPPNPRSYALSPASLKLLGIDQQTTTGATHNNERMKGFYQSMQVWETNQPASLLWSSKDLPQEDRAESSSPSYLGCCIEDAVLTQHLWKELSQADNVSVFSKSQLQNIEWPSYDDGGGGVSTGGGSWVRGSLVTIGSEQQNVPDQSIRTRLLVAADGANSTIRKAAGIPMMSYQYGQTALTFTVKLERSLQGRAFQRFLRTGPLALLPTFSDQHAVIVWSTSPEQAAHWNDAAPADLTAHLNSLLQAGPEQLAPLMGSRHDDASSLWNNILYGIDKVVDSVQYGVAMAAQQQVWDDDQGVVFSAPPVIDSPVSPRFMFPLQLQLPARQQYCLGTHLALVGDAAHSVHPMAGQGLNLGLQDVASLVSVVEKALGSGMDPGTFLREYEASRRKQVGLTLSGIHMLQRLFMGQSPVAKHLKSFGMSVLQNVGPVRRALVQAATQGVAMP